jgi:hypothetical protein
MDELQRSFEALNDAEISKNRSAEIPEGQDYEGEKSFPEAFCDALQAFVDSVKELLGLDTGSESGEVNETLSEKATEVMAEVFDSKTLSEWGTMSMEQREAKLNEYYAGLGEALGIDAKGVVVEDLFSTVGEGILGYNSGDGYLHIDYRNLQDPEQLLEVVQTTTHEARHQLQTEAIADPTRFPEIPPELISEWEHNMTNYDNGSFGYESYYNQGIEVDARMFAAQVINAYKTAMGV